jgi:drug/metabolite transporter (DMT)-like permease
MDKRLQCRSNLILMLTELIWGFAFVAQRVGMEHIGPFAFNALRFALGTLVLVPIALWRGWSSQDPRSTWRYPGLWRDSVIAGLILFGGASLQQGGLVETEAGKAGFITGLYVVLVPIFGLALGQRTTKAAWVGAAVATVGLYLLTVTDSWIMARGDFLVLIGAFVWTLHVHWIAHVAPRVSAIRLALIQFLVATVLSGVISLLFEQTAAADVQAATIPILYAGLLSVGIAFTLQVIGQRHAHPTHAAIIMSLEAVFAVVGGWLLINEILPLRSLIGCLLMMAGMLFSQLQPQGNQQNRPIPEPGG